MLRKNKNKVDPKTKFAEQIVNEIGKVARRVEYYEVGRRYYIYKGIGFDIVVDKDPRTPRYTIYVKWDFELKNRCLMSAPSRLVNTEFDSIEWAVASLVEEVFEMIDKLPELVRSVKEDLITLRRLMK